MEFPGEGLQLKPVHRVQHFKRLLKGMTLGEGVKGNTITLIVKIVVEPTQTL